MKSKATLKVVEKALKKAKVDIKRAKTRGDAEMLAHHVERHRVLEGK